MKMIKTVLLAALAMVAGAMAFAADSYKVEKVTGKVTYEAAPGTWKNVTVGQEISATTNINTSLNSTLVVTGGSGTATIKAMQKGTIASLASASAGTSGGGLKKATVTKSKVGGTTNGSQSGVSTASSRASEAKEDALWDE